MLKQETSIRRSYIGGNEVVNYAEVDVVRGKGGGISGLDTTRLKPHTEFIQRHLDGKLWVDGVIDAAKVDGFLESRREVSLNS